MKRDRFFKLDNHDSQGGGYGRSRYGDESRDGYDNKRRDDEYVSISRFILNPVVVVNT